ncbi:MAG TPA: TetR/AcrR family transcriptional regulator [Vicinamibacterales bacterium]|jgi:AcrR family transcriptional regulator|nr:TetR/AcrR family transcriptional regulator [Vicinamibacterales bacterium]
MGIKERQERDREAVRRAILDAARELFVAEGFQNVSIRKIAERIEYSPAAIYGYFPSKDDIFFALAEEGLHLLGDPSAIWKDPKLANAAPLDQVRAIFWRLYEFSREQPQYFALIFIDRSVPRISREYERFAFARDRKQHIVAALQASVDAGELPRSLDTAAAMRTLMAGVLGVAVLCLSDRLAPEEDPDLLATDMLNLTLAGLKSGIVLQSAGPIECPLEITPIADAQAS